jgi:hypothetical protein
MLGEMPVHRDARRDLYSSDDWGRIECALPRTSGLKTRAPIKETVPNLGTLHIEHHQA